MIRDHLVGLGMTRSMQVKGVTLESHPSPDGDIEMQPHKGAPPEDQRLHNHIQEVACDPRRLANA